MIALIRAELLKQKRTFARSLPVIAPVTAIFLAVVLMMGRTDVYAQSIWNWWYTLLLPAMLAMICYLNIAKEKKQHFFHLTAFETEKKQLMAAKLLTMALQMLAANLILCAGAVLIGNVIFTSTVPLMGALAAVLVLTLTYLWEIPLYLFLSIRFGLLADMLVCLTITVSGIILSQTPVWMYAGSAIPMRLMCPLLYVLPNGLCAEAGNAMLNAGVLLPGLCLSLVWFVLAGLLFLRWFDQSEIKG